MNKFRFRPVLTANFRPALTANFRPVLTANFIGRAGKVTPDGVRVATPSPRLTNHATRKNWRKTPIVIFEENIFTSISYFVNEGIE